jgi:hypothetical protein
LGDITLHVVVAYPLPSIDRLLLLSVSNS